jgi:hypothetical protein
MLPWPAWARFGPDEDAGPVLGPAQPSMLGSIPAPPVMASEFPPSTGEIC